MLESAVVTCLFAATAFFVTCNYWIVVSGLGFLQYIVVAFGLGVLQLIVSNGYPRLAPRLVVVAIAGQRYI